MARITEYINIITTKFFDSDETKKKEFHELWNSIQMEEKEDKPSTKKSSGSICVFIFKRGEKKGQQCTVKSRKGEYCSLHSKTEEKETKKEVEVVHEISKNENIESTIEEHMDVRSESKPMAESTVVTIDKTKCSFIFKRGDKKGQQCTVKPREGEHCSIHTVKVKEAVVSFTSVNSNTEEKKETDNTNTSEKEVKTEVIDDTQKCKFIMKKGDRKDKECGFKKQDNSEFCSVHSKKESKKKACKTIMKTGDRKGEQCGNTDETCPHSKAIHIKKWENYCFIKETNVLFDKNKQVIIGYKSNDTAVFEETEEVREACLKYDLLFISP
jgi:hypothetical protein